MGLRTKFLISLCDLTQLGHCPGHVKITMVGPIRNGFTSLGPPLLAIAYNFCRLRLLSWDEINTATYCVDFDKSLTYCRDLDLGSGNPSTVEITIRKDEAINKYHFIIYPAIMLLRARDVDGCSQKAGRQPPPCSSRMMMA